MKRFTIIAAVAQNNVIGNDFSLLWRIPEDMKHFKDATTGNTVIMGRKTYYSLPKGALPNRNNIVLTRDKYFDAPGCTVVNSLEQAIAIASEEHENYIMGGAEIYELFLPHCHTLLLTEVYMPYEGNVVFPEVDWTKWLKISEEVHHTDEIGKPSYAFVKYEKKASN